MIKEQFAVHMAYAGHEDRSRAAEARKKRNALGKTVFERGKNYLKRRKLLKESQSQDAHARLVEEQARETYAAFQRFDHPVIQSFLTDAAATAAVLDHEEGADHIRDLLFSTPEDRLLLYQSEDWNDAPSIGRVVAEAALASAKLVDTSVYFTLSESSPSDEPAHHHVQHGNISTLQDGPDESGVQTTRDLAYVLGVADQEQVLPESMPAHNVDDCLSTHAAFALPTLGVEVRFHYWGSTSWEKYGPDLDEQREFSHGRIDVEVHKMGPLISNGAPTS